MIWSKNQSLLSIMSREYVAILRKTKSYNANVDLVNDNVYTIFGSICLFVLKIWSKNQILTSIKGHNSVANLRKTIIYNINVDLVDDNVYTKFGLNKSFTSSNGIASLISVKCGVVNLFNESQ